MSLGVTVQSRTAPPSSGAPTATDGWFVAAVTDVGDQGVAQEVRDLATFENLFGPRVAGNIPLWDAMDVFFREGGKRAIISRGTAADLPAALAHFPDTLGPGQVSAIGYTLDAENAANATLWTHAQSTNRVVVADFPPDLAPADQGAFIDVVNDVSGGWGAFFGYPVTVPGPTGVIGAVSRTIPASPVIAALCARVDETGNPNQAAAGRWLPLQYVTSLTRDPTMGEREGLLDSGFNTFASVYGVLENYGFQTPVTEQADNPYWQFNCSRMRMALVAQGKSIGENYMFRPIDGQGALATSFKGALDAMMLDYFNVGALYGDVPADAFRVDVGSQVNTIDSIAQGQLRAVASVALTLHAKSVEIELVTVPVGGQV